MDTRTRILVVEDIDTMRETWIAVLERANYRVEGAATAVAAIAAIDCSSYHVAIVDIMLAGEKDISNRDGAKVLEYLRDVGDRTRALVLSGQSNDITLVRDLLKKYDAFDYIAKWDVEEKGNSFLLQKIKDTVVPEKTISWDELTRTLAWNWMEQAFVSECLHFLKFNGGFENLSRLLLTACQHVMPLLVGIGATRAISRDKVPEVFSGTFWSRGQGTAVELLIYGKNAPKEVLEGEWNLSKQKLLYNHSKADLSVVIIQRSDLTRAHFGPIHH